VSEESVKDPLALGLGSLAAGTGFGGGWMTAAQIALSLGGYRYESTGFYALTAGLVGAIGIGGGCAWYRSFPLDNVWQRGVIAVLAAVGAILVGFLAALVERFFGVLGMAVWLLLSIVLAILATRWAIQGTGKGPAAGGRLHEPH
jgi:hypothetical protein